MPIPEVGYARLTKRSTSIRHAITGVALALIILVLQSPVHTPAQINNSTTAVPQKAQPPAPQESVETVVEPVAEVKPVIVKGSLEEWLTQLNIPRNDWGAISFIFQKESTTCPTRWQGYYGPCPETYSLPYEGAETDTNRGYGLCQSTPAIKMASAGEDWRTNPLTQIRWCANYAHSRYGGWWGAHSAWVSKRWW